jgi:hypothetical protein
MAAKSRPAALRPKKELKEPHVGILWLLNGKPLIDSTPLSEAETYGDYLTHPRSHLEVWTQFQRSRTVPADAEYEELPRGRVMYNRVSSLVTMTPTGAWRSLASRISFLMSGSVTAALSLLSIKSRGSTGAPLGARNANR